MAWSDKLNEVGFAIISLVSPKAYVSPSAQINQGSIIEPLAGVNSNVSVGACSIIKMGALINPNSVVAEGCCRSDVYIADGCVDAGADIFERGLCLPSDNKMTNDEQNAVIEIIKSCFE